MNPDDTIVAVSSPPGAAWRGIVRLSGPAAHAIAGQFFRTQSESAAFGTQNRRVVGRICWEKIDLPAALYLFHAPRSYTRQDMAEVHLLGAPAVLASLVEACLSAGARAAEPGEFTARAFLSGAMDLSQVHGVAGMIAARSDLQLHAAQRLLDGALSRTAMNARERIADLLSLVEGALDFADEPIEFITPSRLCQALEEVCRSLRATVDSALRAERWGALPRVVFVGPPSVGKSSLLNRLTGMDRSITSSGFGTTRDAITAPLSLGSAECLLVDIAGLDDSGVGAVDEPRVLAQRAARKAVREADVLLHVVDASQPVGQAAIPEIAAVAPQEANHDMGAMPGVPRIIALNKCDLVDARRLTALAEAVHRRMRWPTVPVSARTGVGCDELISQIGGILAERSADARDKVVALLAEHHEALESAIAGAERAGALAAACGESLDAADLVAQELRGAAEALGTLVGMEDTEAILGRVFSRFCVGK